MFKKAVEVKSQQRLSGADRKKLRRTIRERFPNASDTDIDTLLPPKVQFIYVGDYIHTLFCILHYLTTELARCNICYCAECHNVRMH